MAYKNRRTATTLALLQIPVDVDLIRFEKNLLQIGFFGSHDTRHRTETTRRIEQMVSRGGQRIKVAAEFRSSALLGLPSTADRDKFLAFMKIAGEERARTGKITNTIRFSGYRLLKELGHTTAGENYEEISKWGKRMADTTITSEQVIYFAARKQYADQTVHVFRSFKRLGQSTLSGSSRSEAYEVVLEDWLLENLNQSYVIPEDFNAYKQLKRPTAKGIFGNLHVWFHASQGRPIEKDYLELCNLLNVQSYPHLSKIKETMGRSLDELIGVRYLSQWDIQPMTTKVGFKLVLSPGDELMRILAITHKKQIGPNTSAETELSAARQEALSALIAHGIAPAKAMDLVSRCDPETVIDQTEYVASQTATDRRGRIENPAGLLIYTIENNLPLPADFVTSRRRRAQQEQRLKAQKEKDRETTVWLEYQEWREQLVEAELKARYPSSALANKINEVAVQRRRTDEVFARVTPDQREKLALQLLRKELREELQLPSLEEWVQSKSQIELFCSASAVQSRSGTDD
jgi:Replication initiator protein A